jgi:hypothetical protein
MAALSGLDSYSPKAKVVRSNRIGCARFLNDLADIHRTAGASTEAPRKQATSQLRAFGRRSSFSPNRDEPTARRHRGEVVWLAIRRAAASLIENGSPTGIHNA